MLVGPIHLAEFLLIATTSRVVRLSSPGTVVTSYLGKWNTKASRAEYDRVIGEWLAAGRCLTQTLDDLTIAELAARYLDHAKTYYKRNIMLLKRLHHAGEIEERAAQAIDLVDDHTVNPVGLDSRQSWLGCLAL